MRLLRQSTAFTFRAGPFLDATDGVTAETALSIAQADIQISKAGGAFAQTSASPTTAPAATPTTVPRDSTTSVPTTVTSTPATAPAPSAPATSAPATSAPATTAAPTTTVRPPGVPKDWPANKPIPPMPADCEQPQLEDNGVWNCQ